MNIALKNSNNEIHWWIWKRQICFNHLTTVSYTIVQPFQDSAIVQDAQFTSWWRGYPKPDSIPTRPESSRKTVHVKKEFHVHQAVFRQVPCIVSKNSFKKSNNFGLNSSSFFLNSFATRFLPGPDKLWVKGWCTCNLQCFDNVRNLLSIICHCPEIFTNFWKSRMKLRTCRNLLWLV